MFLPNFPAFAIVTLTAMKTGTLVLALLTATVQTVGWVECCCILICKHRNDPCSDCKEKQETPIVADCCDKSHEAPARERRCAHIEPQSDVDSTTTALPAVDLDLVLDLPGDRFEPAQNDVPAPTPSNGIRGSPPLHLLYSVLLI